MWEAPVVCKSCEGTHLVRADVLPRSFSFECPQTGERVDMPFRDPSRMSEPWAEVATPSPEAIPTLFEAEQGSF